MQVKFDMSNAEVNFARALDQMGKLTGLDPRAILKAEAGSVLKKAITATKAPPSQSTLTVAGRIKALRALGLTGGGEVSINAGKKAPYGRVFVRKKNGDGYRRTHDAGFHPLNQHYTDAMWAKITAAISDAKRVIAKVVPSTKAAAGLARQSWVLIADSLGIRLEEVPGGGLSPSAISRVRGAVARGGKQINNGSSVTVEEPGKFGVILINRLPYGDRLHFQPILTAAIAGRAKFMQTAISKGFNGSMEQVAKLFPGWTVKPGSN